MRPSELKSRVERGLWSRLVSPAATKGLRRARDQSSDLLSRLESRPVTNAAEFQSSGSPRFRKPIVAIKLSLGSCSAQLAGMQKLTGRRAAAPVMERASFSPPLAIYMHHIISNSHTSLSPKTTISSFSRRRRLFFLVHHVLLVSQGRWLGDHPDDTDRPPWQDHA